MEFDNKMLLMSERMVVKKWFWVAFVQRYWKVELSLLLLLLKMIVELFVGLSDDLVFVVLMKMCVVRILPFFLKRIKWSRQRSSAVSQLNGVVNEKHKTNTIQKYLSLKKKEQIQQQQHSATLTQPLICVMSYQQSNPPIHPIHPIHQFIQFIQFIQFNNQYFAFSTHFSTTYFFVIDQ